MEHTTFTIGLLSTFKVSQAESVGDWGGGTISAFKNWQHCSLELCGSVECASIV